MKSKRGDIVGDTKSLIISETNIYTIIKYLEKVLPINSFISINTIYEYLNLYNFGFTKEELENALSIMMIEYRSVIKNNYLMKSDEYCLLDQDKRNTRFAIAYRKLIDDMPCNNKSFLLISDTHFGSEKENYELVKNLYSYAKKQNVCACFHLGDIFNKMDGDNIDIIKKLYKMFEIHYPKGIKTYSICGNHDQYMHTVCPIRPLYDIPKIDIPLDIRILNRLNSDFNSFASEYFSTTINNVKFHFNHKLYINSVERDKKIDKLSDIDDKSNVFSCDEKILISGHLHDGFIYTTSNNIYLGVPSSSNLNKNGIVGYILDVNNEGCNIRVLKLKENGDIYEIENFWINYDNIPIIRKEYKTTAKTLKNEM